MRIARNDVNEYIDFVKAKYPEAQIDFWFEHGELLFYKNPQADVMKPCCCIKRDGKFEIIEEF